MSDLSFQRGEILTAAKLNQLVQAVTSGAPSAAGGNGNVPPAQPHQVRQREFSSYVPIRRPIYIDQTSPHWPLANGTPGWYWRESAGAALTAFPLDMAPGDDVYLKTELSPLGIVETVTPQYMPIENEEWNPFKNKKGVICEQLGKVAEDPYKSGTKATTWQFFEAPASPVIPLLLASPPSTVAPEASGAPGDSGATQCWVPSFMPPATYLTQASLLGPRLDNTQLLNTINSDGGLIFKEFYSCVSGAYAGGIEVIPRLAILPAPSTEPPATPPAVGSQLPPGSWHEMAAVNIAGQKLSLNMAWLNPWMAYINLAVSGGSGTLHQTWKKAWGLPGGSAPPGSFSVGSGDWHEVSRTSPNIQLLVPEMFPSACAWVMQEEKILQANGTVAPGTDENGDMVYLPVIFQAYLRRQLAPQTGCWCIWYDKCWTNLYD